MTRRNGKPMKASELNGLFIYHDQKKGTIFYDIFTKRAFIITSSDVQKYLLYASMFPVCILVSFGLMSILSLSLADMVILFIALMILTETLFRFFFFYKLPEVKNWKPDKNGSIISYLAGNYSFARLLILMILLILLVIFIPLYSYVEKTQGYALYLNYGLAAAAAVFAIIVVIAMIRKKKEN